MQQGTWSNDEHDRFLVAIKYYPEGPWRMIASHVGTRSVRQVQTHAQKYHEKVARRMRGVRKERRKCARQEHRIDHELYHTLSPSSDHQLQPTHFMPPHAAIDGLHFDPQFFGHHHHGGVVAPSSMTTGAAPHLLPPPPMWPFPVFEHCEHHHPVAMPAIKPSPEFFAWPVVSDGYARVV